MPALLSPFQVQVRAAKTSCSSLISSTAWRKCVGGLAVMVALGGCGGGSGSSAINGASAPATQANGGGISANNGASTPATQPSGSGTSTNNGASTPATPPSTPATQASAQQLISPSFYVSPTGSDSNKGQSASAPFLTLEKAQAAMQASSIKATYLMGGIFARTTTLSLGPADSGESWLAYPGQTPVLDGANTVNTAISIFEGNDVSIRWITIQNFALNGISANAVSGVLIDSNTIKNIQSNAWAQGAMVLAGYTNGRVSHNVIQNVQYDGILAASWEGNTITNLIIEDNAIDNTCISIADCGGIYAVDLAHTSTGLVINNNVVSNYGTSTNASKAIYLDDELSNATVENNIVRGTGTYAFQIHGGDHNVLRNNIFDISGAETLSLYQASAASNPNYGMSDNAFTCNIVYSSSAPPSSLWVYMVQPIDAPPAVNNNLYWDTSAALPNTGSVVDAIPTVANPDFVNPSQANYAFASTPPSFCVFAPIDTSQVGPVPNP